MRHGESVVPAICAGDFCSENQSNYAGYNSCVNFLTCHDGFTMYDLYAYNTKHNEENGWNDTDGMDDNRSWNCGAEGKPIIRTSFVSGIA